MSVPKMVGYLLWTQLLGTWFGIITLTQLINPQGSHPVSHPVSQVERLLRHQVNPLDNQVESLRASLALNLLHPQDNPALSRQENLVSSQRENQVVIPQHLQVVIHLDSQAESRPRRPVNQVAVRLGNRVSIPQESRVSNPQASRVAIPL